MNYFIFLVASSIEYFGSFMFMFALFRFRIRKQVVMNILLVSFLMSQVSYFTRINPEVEPYSTFLQFPLFVIVFWVLFLIPFFYSVIMNFASVAIGFLVQAGCLLVILQVADLTAVEFLDSAWNKALLQVMTCLVHIALARTIVVMNWGFDFVPTSPRSNVRIGGTNAILIGIISFAIVFAAMLAFVFRNNLNAYVVSAGVVFILTVPLFIFYSLKKDNEDASKYS